MFTKELFILEVFTREPWEGLTFKQIKKLSKNKSDNYVHNVLKKFVKLSVLKEKRYDKRIVYFLAKNETAMRFLSIVSEEKASKIKYLPHKNIEKLIEKIPTNFFSFIITGSYAKGKQTIKSDLDIVVICSNSESIKRILIPIKNEGGLQIPEVHPYVFTEGQFLEMLTNKEENYGKEIARNSIVITGGEAFYRILFKAIDNGFKG